MASKKNNPKGDPAPLTVRCVVYEYRERGPRGDLGWRPWVTSYEYGTTPSEAQAALDCARMSEQFHGGREFRYRAATLTFDDDGRKATIY